MFWALNQVGNFFSHFFFASICTAISCIVTLLKVFFLNKILAMVSFKWVFINDWISEVKICGLNVMIAKEDYRFLVKFLTILLSDKNSFKITLIAV